MHLDGRLGSAKRGPGEQRQAQIDRRGIQGIDGVVQIETRVGVGVEFCGLGDQMLGEVGMDLPGTGPVGVGQGVPGDPLAAEAGVIAFGAEGSQTGFDVAQRPARSIERRPWTDTDRDRKTFGLCDGRDSVTRTDETRRVAGSP